MTFEGAGITFMKIHHVVCKLFGWRGRGCGGGGGVKRPTGRNTGRDTDMVRAYFLTDDRK
jgi:hypothetical protein